MGTMGKQATGTTNRNTSATNPGVYMALFLVALWVLCWVVGMGFFRTVLWAGVPVVTWLMIGFGIVAIIVSIIAIPLFRKWDNG